jgi:succinate dehydrogenase / fumarate reductase iron-sulfur subunit
MPRRRLIDLKVRRQDGPNRRPYWEGFLLERHREETVADLLRLIEVNPTTAKGRRTSTVVWEHGCGDGNCGSCAMLINGKPLLACRAMLDDFPPSPIILEPLTKFPVIRDLWVDRTAVFEALKRVESWLEVDSYQDSAPGRKVPPDAAGRACEFARCIHCGICLEVCPSFNRVSRYVGAAAIASSAAYQELQPEADNTRLLQRVMMQPGGVTGCGSAMNCVKLCPQGIPLTNAIAITNRRVNTRAWAAIQKRD